MKNAYDIFVVKPECKRLLGRPRRRWVDNIRMDLGEIRREGADWMPVAQAGCCEQDNEPSGVMKSAKFLDWLNDC
jgi:hypothetical protein